MISIIGGKLGAGKTLLSTMRMFEIVCSGRTVVTNVETVFTEFQKLAFKMKGVYLEETQLRYINPETDRNWQKKIPFGTPDSFVELFLDEIHLFFNSRDWAQTQKNSPDLISFLSQSRKAHVNITFIVQDSETLDKQFRLQAEWEYFVLSSEHIPLGPLGKFPIKFMIVRKSSARKGQLISKEFKGYDKRFYKLYKSFSFLDDKMKVLGQNADRPKAIKLRKLSLFRRLLVNLSDRYLPPLTICVSSSSSSLSSPLPD
jgi:hypothetical protein